MGEFFKRRREGLKSGSRFFQSENINVEVTKGSVVIVNCKEGPLFVDPQGVVFNGLNHAHDSEKDKALKSGTVTKIGPAGSH